MNGRVQDAPSLRARRRVRLTAALAGSALGVFFLLAGARKLYGWDWAMHVYRHDHPVWVYYASAVGEVATGIGLLLPRLRFGSAVAQLLLIAWVTFVPLRPPDPSTAGPAVVTTVLLVAVAVITRPATPRA
ncbi:hypothetical protein [Actinomadura rayongensis]|uniref:DoxX family protein n=1 Tax=Actinomadura rayongensis TaxID=1429076 RepID=A0A6I4W663_9ACTN|nr:hypothetical protein [Actinomadura rayongensis]MXQ64260.1 hypothetical protein [Actinomadura rayongensis]